MRALITNDDGVESPGLEALAQAVIDLGLDAVIAAPSWDSSGASASLTAVEHDGRLLVNERRHERLGGAQMFAIEAAPAFIARLGVRGAFGAAPDIVLSGINRGPNTGYAVLHSGTVGAALTAFTHGCRAAAFSLDAGTEPRWETAAAVARPVIRWLLDAPAPMALNVNVPNLALAELRGLCRAELSPFGAVQTTITEQGKGYVKLGFSELDRPQAPNTDSGLLAAGYACYTPLLAVCAAPDVDTSTLAMDGAGRG
jgi:5'-nucleotidase